MKRWGRKWLSPFLVCQACISAIGCKSRIHFTVGSISQGQGCPSWDGIWRKQAANIRAYEQKLHIRQGSVGDVAKQTKARYCTEHYPVNAEATWMESGYTYPERSENNPAETWGNVEAETDVRTKNDIMVFSEVSRGHSKPETSRTRKKKRYRRKSHRRTKDWMLEWWSNQEVYGTATTTETRKRTFCARISRKLKGTQKELSQTTQPMRATPGNLSAEQAGKFFLVVCLKKY